MLVLRINTNLDLHRYNTLYRALNTGWNISLHTGCNRNILLPTVLHRVEKEYLTSHCLHRVGQEIISLHWFIDPLFCDVKNDFGAVTHLAFSL